MLHLPERMKAVGWEALNEVTRKGKVNTVRVSKSTLRSANNQHDWIGSITITNKSDAGLQKLQAINKNK